MIRILFRQQLDEKEFKEKRKITLKEVAVETGISRPTINRIANTLGYNTNLETIDALCRYFECELDALLVVVDDG